MKLALGTVQFGKAYGVQKNKKPDLAESIQLMVSAVKAGVTVLDTAAAYGNAEAILGEFVCGGYAPRSSISIITKLPSGVLDDISADNYRSEIETEVVQSLSRIKTDYLDGLLFHDAKYVYNTNAMNAMIRSKCLGYVNRVGISVYTPDEALRALAYGIDIIQVPYNIMDQRLDQIGFFKQAKERGITVLARSSLLQGLLAMCPEDIPSYMDFAQPFLLRFHEACKTLNLTPVECAIMFAAKHPHIDYLLFGIDNANQLEEVISASHKDMDITAYQYLSQLFSDVPEQVVMPNLWPLEV